MRSVKQTMTGRVLLVFLAALLTTSLVALPALAKMDMIAGSSSPEGDPTDGHDFSGGGGGIFDSGDSGTTTEETDPIQRIYPVIAVSPLIVFGEYVFIAIEFCFEIPAIDMTEGGAR